MSIGAPSTDHPHLVVLIAVDAPALHALDQSSGIAGAGGAVFAYAWFGGIYNATVGELA